jgi:flagellar biosynthetic protein FliR
MNWLEIPSLHLFLVFTLVFIRVSGLFMVLPIFGTSDVPMQARALLSFALAVLITPTQTGASVQDPGTLLGFLILVAGELFVGLTLGLGIVTLFSGVQVAGQLIGRTSGLTMAEVYDPSSGENIPELAHLLFLVTMAVFVAIGGHRMVLAGLLDTFVAMPPGGGILPSSLEAVVKVVETLLTESFVLGIRAAAPLLTALLLATLVTGLISRTLPQLNVLAIGFSLNALVTFGILALSLGAAVWVFQDPLESAVEMLVQAIGGGN